MKKTSISIPALSLLFLGITLFTPLYGCAAEKATVSVRNESPALKTDSYSAIKGQAKRGNIKAKVKLAEMYYSGNGVKQNYKKALKLYKKAAADGDTAAMRKLGDIYTSGLGAIRNYEEAFKWYESAAMGGDVLSARKLGELYLKGQGGDPTAQFNLGEMYMKGNGLPRDYVLSYKWFNLSNAGGFRAAAAKLDKLEAKMTPEEVARAQRITREFKKK